MSVAHTALQEWTVMGMAKRDLITKDFALYVVHYFNAMQTWNKEDILSEIDRTIKEAKPEDAVPVVHAKWRLNNDGSGTCGNCHRTTVAAWDMDSALNYCPHCGSRMDGE